MRTALVHPLFFVALLACNNIGWAQASVPSQAPSQTPSATATAVQQPARALPKADLSTIPQPATAQPGSRTNQLIERIHVEGGTSSIDEVRVGGETRSITVQPKGGLPAYDVQPATGTRAWKVLGF